MTLKDLLSLRKKDTISDERGNIYQIVRRFRIHKACCCFYAGTVRIQKSGIRICYAVTEDDLPYIAFSKHERGRLLKRLRELFAKQ